MTEREYARKLYEAKKAYDEAKTEEERKEIASAGRALENELMKKGNVWLARKFARAIDRENDLVDFDESYEYETAQEFIEALKRNGVERFTFSSSWSSAVKVSWELQKAGCTIEGMTEINEGKHWGTDIYEKTPAYIFKIN